MFVVFIDFLSPSLPFYLELLRQALSSVQLDVVILVDSEGEVMFECLVDKMRAFMDETGWLVFCVIDHLIKSNLLLLYVNFVGFTV